MEQENSTNDGNQNSINQFEGLNHGISIERLLEGTANPLSLCLKCAKIFWSPQECTACGSTFCDKCLSDELKSQKNCPTGGNPTK